MTSKYIVSADLKRWGQAKVACKNFSMALASIETEEANNCIKEKIQFAGWRIAICYLKTKNILMGELIFFRKSGIHCLHCAEQNGSSKLHDLADRIGGRNQWMGHRRTSTIQHRKLRCFQVSKTFTIAEFETAATMAINSVNENFNNFVHVSMNRNGKWIDTLCSGANSYVCESPAPTDVCKSLCSKFLISRFLILINYVCRVQI